VLGDFVAGEIQDFVVNMDSGRANL
jgi:hypothetical protein